MNEKAIIQEIQKNKDLMDSTAAKISRLVEEFKAQNPNLSEKAKKDLEEIEAKLAELNQPAPTEGELGR